MPAYGVRAYEVAEKAGNVTKAVSFVPMDRVIVVGECIFK